MARRSVAVEGRVLTVAGDEPLAADLQPWAVLRARAVDELTLQAPAVPVRLSTTLPRAVARVAEGGLCGLVARPRDVAGALQRPGALAAWLEAPGYLPRDLTPAIDAARRALAAAVVQGAAVLPVTPADPIPPAPGQRLQFRPGRGVLTERAAPADADDFSLVADTPPATAADVPLRTGLASARGKGLHVAGVPLVLGDQPLHRARALRLRGRIRRVLAAPQPTLVPAPAASIGIVGYWRSYPEAQHSAHQPLDFCAIDPPLAQPLAEHDTVAVCAPTSGAVRSLQQAAAPGSRALWLHPHAGLKLGGGDWLLVGDPQQPGIDVVKTAGIEGTPDPASPALVRLHAPTAFLHHADAPLRDLGLPAVPPAPFGEVLREGLPGDPVLFASHLAPLPTQGWLLVAAATARESLHRYTQLPRATPTGNPAPNDFSFEHPGAIDAEGWFDWPALGRVAQLALVALQGGQRLPEFNFALDYGGDNPLSLILP